LYEPGCGSREVAFCLCHMGSWGLQPWEFSDMCDYSLQHTLSRPAAVGDKLTTREFPSGTRGFAAPENPAMAVCVLPGTELAFSRQVTFRPGFLRLRRRTTSHTTAVLRQINQDVSEMHHDALEFPDGQIILLNNLCEDQVATVLQLPAQPTTRIGQEEQRRPQFVR